MDDSWFDLKTVHYVKMAKYWAAKEMADDIWYEQKNADHYWGGNYHCSMDKFKHLLTQILKKEWFR